MGYRVFWEGSWGTALPKRKIQPGNPAMVQATVWVMSGRDEFAGRNIPEGGPLVPVFARPGATAAEAVAWEGLREELERGLNRAGWVLCIACWDNGHICGCRWTGFGESRVQLSCHTRRSVAGRQFCRLMGQGESGTRGSGLLLSDTHRTALGSTFSPHSAGSTFSQGTSKRWVRGGAGPRRALLGPRVPESCIFLPLLSLSVCP